MKCAQHSEVDAAGTCNACGRGLCAECVAVFTTPLCPNCALAHNKTLTASFRNQLMLMGALFVIAMVISLGMATSLTSAIQYSLMAAFFPPGWKFLGRYFSPSGGYMYMSARWTNLLLQTAVAAFVGIVVGPIYLFNVWRELKVAADTKRSIGG